MAILRVFIASSVEGLEIANATRERLLAKLGDTLDVRVWTREFDLSRTYIESLERATAEADFAVLVLTPDDVTTSRRVETLAPRDNVVFELGLFMGSLGRERCFIVCEDRAGLKLPTDLLGVKSAVFQRDVPPRSRKSLAAQCGSIAERISLLGARHKFDQSEVAVQSAIRAFCARVEGAWWSRITRDDPVTLSFVHIEADPLFNTVCLKGGKSFDKTGKFIANWKSLLAGVDVGRLLIRYHWSGWHTTPNYANALFHGFGEMEFNKTASPKGRLLRGSGRFWDVDEVHPERTKVKPCELRRAERERDLAIMAGGNDKDVRAVVRRIIAGW